MSVEYTTVVFGVSDLICFVEYFNSVSNTIFTHLSAMYERHTLLTSRLLSARRTSAKNPSEPLDAVAPGAFAMVHRTSCKGCRACRPMPDLCALTAAPVTHCSEGDFVVILCAYRVEFASNSVVPFGEFIEGYRSAALLLSSFSSAGITCSDGSAVVPEIAQDLLRTVVFLKDLQLG